jgi:hypothetical protein
MDSPSSDLELVTYYVWETKHGILPVEVNEIDLLKDTPPQEAVEFIAELDIANLNPETLLWPLFYYVQVGSTTAPILEVAVSRVPSFSLDTMVVGFSPAPEPTAPRLHALGEDLNCLESCMACGAERLNLKRSL